MHNTWKKKDEIPLLQKYNYLIVSLEARAEKLNQLVKLPIAEKENRNQKMSYKMEIWKIKGTKNG